MREVEEVEVEKVRSERKEEESDKGGGSDHEGGGGFELDSDHVRAECELDDSGIHSDIVEEDDDSAPKSRLVLK